MQRNTCEDKKQTFVEVENFHNISEKGQELW